MNHIAQSTWCWKLTTKSPKLSLPKTLLKYTVMTFLSGIWILIPSVMLPINCLKKASLKNPNYAVTIWYKTEAG